MSGSVSFGEQTLQVGDLGRFSMRAIYDALATSQQNTTPSISIPSRHADGEDSDCSWTSADESGNFYFDMQKRLSNFIISDSDTMTTAWLTKSQRRFVHATAQIMQLGHASLGSSGKLRQMFIFKHPSTPLFNIPALQSIEQTVTPKKRRRVERVEKGFPCSSCPKVFDRASERTKHEQAHQPSLTARHPCPVCQKAFRYPKDVRRHSKIHDRLTTPRSESQSLSTSYDSSNAPLQSTMTADSRVPSDTSLTFSSNAASKDTSPLLLGRGAGMHIPGLNLEPLEALKEDETWLADADDWLFDPRMSFDNGQDEDFLQMALVTPAKER